MDNAIRTGLYPGYSIDELRAIVKRGDAPENMIREIARREAVAAGDVSQMSQSEKLRQFRSKR